jgi:hypothetical protein
MGGLGGLCPAALGAVTLPFSRQRDTQVIDLALEYPFVPLSHCV